MVMRYGCLLRHVTAEYTGALVLLSVLPRFARRAESVSESFNLFDDCRAEELNVVEGKAAVTHAFPSMARDRVADPRNRTVNRKLNGQTVLRESE